MNKYSTNIFIQQLKEDAVKNTLFSIRELIKYKKERKEELGRVLHLNELDKYSVEPVYKKVKSELVQGITITEYAVTVTESLTMPIYVMRPANANGKTVIYLHGHDANGVRGTWMLNPDREPYHKNLPLNMAKAGFTVIAPELLGYGDAVYEYLLKGKPAKGECFFHYAFLTLFGYDLSGVRVWQTLRVLDFAEKMGCEPNTLFGVSGGGLVCEMAGVMDERIQNIMISSYVNAYEDSIFAKEQCIDNYIHGVGRIGNSYELLALAAPKNMLLLNGTADRPFPLEGTKKAFACLEEVYKEYHARDRLQTCIFEGRHEINSDIVLAWMEKFIG